MAIKKISYDLGGKIKEIASSSVSYDDATGRITANKLSFSTASVGTGEGLLSTIAGGVLSASKGGAAGDIVSWSTASNSWVTRGDTVNLTGVSATNDLGGTYNNATVKRLSNVTIGTLNVANGGTGLTSAQVSALGTGSALLVGHGTSAMTLIKDVDVGDLSKKPVLSANSDGTGWSYITQSAPQANVDVQVFTSNGNWYKPANTKMIRVLAQGAGGGGGSGANRNSAVAALGGAGGSAGAFVDSGLFYVDDSFLTASVVVSVGGDGALFPVTNSAGFAGSAGGSSSFGSASNGPYFAANGGLGGGSGSLNSAVTSSGGASVTASSNIYDLVNYNNTKVLNSSRSGSSNSTTTGISNPYTYTAGTTYYNGGGGASGGSLAVANYTTNYAGGNGGTNSINSGSATVGLYNARIAISSSATSSIGSFAYPQDIFIASGGGGGASAAVTQSIDETYSLIHFNSSDSSIKDYSLWNATSTTGSTCAVINSPVGLPSNIMSDGVLSSSYFNSLTVSQSCVVTPVYSFGTQNCTSEAWFYLVNTGSYTGVNSSCTLMGMGSNTLLTLDKSGFLRTFFNSGFQTSTALKPNLNTWNHIVLQRSGSTLAKVYLNGTASAGITIPAASSNSSTTFFVGGDTGFTNPNGYIKEFKLTNRATTESEIIAYYNAVKAGTSGSFTNPSTLNSYPGGLGGNGAWGSGGGGAGASTNNTGSLVGTRQGGNGGDGYVAVISYKDF